MAWPRWRHTLNESKRLAVSAVDGYNSSTGHYADFVGTMIRAWLYLLHAKFDRDKVDFTYKAKDGSPKLIDGEPASWELSTCIEKHISNDQHPVRQNVELFIALRNKVEHRYEHGLSEAVGGRAHALVINYQNELVSLFGVTHSLADTLRFPIFLDSLGAPSVKQAVKNTQAVKAARTIVAKFDAGLDDTVKDDTRYDYRVTLVQNMGGKSSRVFDFVSLSDLSPEAQAELAKLGKSGKVITKIKKVPVAGEGLMLPQAVVDEVNDRLPFDFTLHHHTTLWKRLQVRPGGPWIDPGGPCNTEFCIPMEATKQYLYTKNWVTKILKTVGTPQKFAEFFGHAPFTSTAELK